MQAVNHDFFALHRHDQIVVDIFKVEGNSDVSRQDTSVEMDEMWSYVGCKDNQRWLWHAVDRITGKMLAYVLGRRRDEVFLSGIERAFGVCRQTLSAWLKKGGTAPP